MARYLATKEGWDGKRIIKPKEIFNFSGTRGSWMVPCDEAGTPLKGEALPPASRPVRAGTKSTVGLTRDALRARCRELGIPFGATLSGVALADLIRQHEEGDTPLVPEVKDTEKSALASDQENTAGTEKTAGTGNLEVL
jgi:hypothetical protein